MTSAARTIVAAAQLGLLAGLLLVGAAVALRRLAGEPKVPLTPWMLAVTAVGFAAACLLVRLMSRRLQRPTAARWIDQVTHFAPLLACALLVAGALLPGTSLLGACLLVGLLTVEETWCLARPAQDGPRQGVGSQFRDESGLRQWMAGYVTKWTPDPFNGDESIDQQFTRRRGPNGEELIEGIVRARFAAGQRTAEAHIAFCPPMEQRPRVEYEVVSGPAARIELGQVLPLGARLDVKLAQAAAQETAILVRVIAKADGPVVAGRAASSRCA